MRGGWPFHCNAPGQFCKHILKSLSREGMASMLCMCRRG